MQDLINKIHNADCLELMKEIPDKSIDMICCDLPYGTTACKWDTIIPFGLLWGQYKRIIKDNGAIVLFGSEPFSSYLRMSNIKNYKYDWIWVKTKGVGFLNSNKQPLRKTENISVFYYEQSKYYPQGLIVSNKNNKAYVSGMETYGSTNQEYNQEVTYKNYPNNILKFDNDFGIHPTQKPVALFEYLIKTYTNEGNLVLDNCSGSGTTAIACVNTNRNFICIEKDKQYYESSCQRLENYNKQLKLF